MKIIVSWELPKEKIPQNFSKKFIQLAFKKIAFEIKKIPEFKNAKKSLGFSPARIGLLICDDELMRDYQKKFRRLDRTTDVLSFPALEAKRPRDFKDEKSLGDLIISVPAVLRGAKRRKPRSFKMEFKEVLIHGCLHLLGLDHVRSKKEARLMQAYQIKILKLVSGTQGSAL